MSNILTITGRELKSYFLSPLAYIITGVFAVFIGFAFFNSALGSRQATLSDDFGWMMVLALILAPALTMRLFAEENRQGTIELLMTAPVRDWEIVVGKYIAGLLTYVALLIPTLWHVVILVRYGPPDYGPILTGYLGALLVGAAFIAVGMFTSSLTQNQVVAYLLAMITLLFLWIIGGAAGITGVTGTVADLLRFLSLPTHFQDFFNGLIDSEHVLYFLSLAAIAVFLTMRVVESRRWR
jgi:gliding motility-associated transport system permease protein